VHVIRRNLGWLLVSQFSTWGLSIFLLLVVPHKLGDAAFGQLSFAMVYVGFFELVALFGTATFLMKVVSRDNEAVGKYVFNALVLKVLVASTLVALAIGLAVALDFDSEIIVLICCCCIGMFLNTLNNGFVGGLQGLQRMRGPAVADVLRAYVAGLVGLAILFNGGTLPMFTLTGNLAAIIPLALNAKFIWPHLREHCKIDIATWKHILRGGLPFFIWSALATFYGTIDIPLLHAFSGDETVGWYALAYRWVGMPIFFASVVGTAFLPALSAEMLVLKESFARLANRALHLVMLVATPAAVGIALIAKDFLAMLYGTEFAQTAPIMQVLALQIPVVSMDIILGTVVIAADRQRKWVIVGLIAAIFNPILNIAALPLTQNLFDNAAIGAAAVTVLTELILMVGGLMLRPAGVLDRATTSMLLRIIAASAAMVPVVLALGSTPLLVRVIAGAVTYGIASIILRTISPQDFRDVAFGSPQLEEQPTGVAA
jgi:O-antigen/teichoic acid export membrane protein